VSNHLSGPDLQPPRGDGRLDFTDLFAFQAPDDPTRCVLIMDVNPFAPSMGEGLHPDAVYRINIDNDGDLQADVAFSFVFSPPDDNGRQSATVRMATGEQAREPQATGETIVEGVELSSGSRPNVAKAGPFAFAAGLRSDPFFADFDGFLNNFQWTGKDTIADKNVYSIALEFPIELLGPSSNLALWARVSLRSNGNITSVDRGGQPTLTAIFNPEDAKDEYNQGEPAQDRQRYLERFAEVLEHAGGYGHDDAVTAAKQILPDVLRFDFSKPATFPNGRVPTDHVIEARLAILGDGQIPSDGLKPHDDLLPEFPYLGPPHVAATPPS
jgi:Domain of unknown function (DUF4331)